MNILLFMGIFWSIYGLLGLLGVQWIPSIYRGKSWTKSYVHCCGVSWMLLGLSWLGFYLVAHGMNIEYFIEVILLAAISIPSIVYTFAFDRKYKAMLKDNRE